MRIGCHNAVKLIIGLLVLFLACGQKEQESNRPLDTPALELSGATSINNAPLENGQLISLRAVIHYEECESGTAIVPVEVNEDGKFQVSFSQVSLVNEGSVDCARNDPKSIEVFADLNQMVAKTNLEQATLQKASAGATKGSVTLDFQETSTLVPTTTSPPDLEIDPRDALRSMRITREQFDSTSCALQEGCLFAPGDRRLLRFTTTVRNTGGSELKIGAPEVHEEFEFSACHKHHHLNDITSYELVEKNTRQPANINGVRVVGRKQGFCFRDSERFGNGPSTAVFDCELQGLSAGWTDVYDSTLDCQWLDITDLRPGNYLLRLVVNPTGIFSEMTRVNNVAEIPVTIPAE